MYEVESKFAVADPREMERRLVSLAARFRDPVDQIDRYFAHPCRDFARTDEALRLRREGNEIALTWKGPRIDAVSKTRREIELPLAPGAAVGVDTGASADRTFEQWTELLVALGFRPVMSVSKRRRSARVPWQGTEIEACLDRVEGLGDFLELEILAGQGEVPLARACVESLAHELGCETTERRSYLELLLRQQQPIH